MNRMTFLKRNTRTTQEEQEPQKQIVPKKMYRKTLLVDFFCGCGGFTAGMAKSGLFEPLLAVDIQEFKLLMMQSNFPNVVCMRWMLKTNEIDINDTNLANNEPADSEDMLNTIIELGIQRANLGEKARREWREGNFQLIFHPCISMEVQVAKIYPRQINRKIRKGKKHRKQQWDGTLASFTT